MSDDNELDMRKLEKLIRALKKGQLRTIKIGIFGSSQRRDGKSNALIGAIHEFGSSKSPQRSFLRQPIQDHLEKELESNGAFDPATLQQVVGEGSTLPWFKKIALTAEAIVAEAFSSGGYGKWVPSNMAHKKNHQTLVETQQLRNSVTTVIKDG